MLELESHYAASFRELLSNREMSDPAAFADVEYFEEEPVYLYYDQLDFLAGLSYSAANSVLIRGTALHLARVVSSAPRAPEGKCILRMVSITDWLGDYPGAGNYDGSTGFLTPHIWMANLSDPRLDGEFPVWHPSSEAAHFVRNVISDDSRFSVAEGPLDRFGAPAPDRVYIYLPGSEGTDRLRFMKS